MKKFRNIAVFALVAAFAFGTVGCGGSNSGATNTPSPAGTKTEQPTGGTEKGVQSQEFVAVYPSEVATLNYLKSNKTVDSAATTLFVDALVQNDKFGAPVPGVATSWEQSADGMTWTVKIRDNVKWVTNKGVEYATVTAQDYVTAAKYLLNPANACLTADMVLGFIAGAEEYYAAMEAYNNGSSSVEPDIATVGVKAIDATTIEYSMIQPTPFFFSLLTYSSYLPVNEQFLAEVGDEEFGTDIDKILYNGEFLFDSWERDKERIYIKNESYYQADRVHIPRIQYLFVEDQHVALEMFKRGEVSQSVVYADQLDQVLSDPELSQYAFQTRAQAGSFFDAFKFDTPNADFSTAIKNLNFRKAIFAAENREILVSTTVTKNVDQYLINTFVPIGLAVTEGGKDYLDFGDLPAIRERNPHNVQEAKKYMAEAVAELGSTVTWPVVLNYPQGSSEAAVQSSMLFKQMMEDTFPEQITVNFKPYTSAQFYDMMDEGDFDFAQSGWSADYADPSNYLNLLLPGEFYDGMYGFNELPEMKEYVALMEVANSITDLDERYEAFAKAEAFLLNNAIINPMQRSGGNYSLNAIQNPYDVPRAEYGMSPDLFLDRIYGETPLTVDERNAQREQYEREVAERAANAK